MPARQSTTPSKSTRIQAGETAKAVSARRAGQKGNSGSALSDEELHQLVARSAYRRAEKRAFAPGHELDDWLEAEREIKQGLGNSG